MARRIEPMKNGFAKIDGKAVNLKEFKKIEKDTISAFESGDEEDRLSIKFTPSAPTLQDMENNVDGAFHMTYGSNETDDYEADYEALLIALNS